MELTDIEERWLAYAYDVVTADDHTAACLAAGGGCLEPNGSPELRWPGYLGRSCRPGGLLLVGNVHRNFSSNGVSPSVSSELVAATRDWRKSPNDGEDYLQQTRRVYLAGLASSPRWRVSIPFSYLLARLHLTWEVVHTPTARSRS